MDFIKVSNPINVISFLESNRKVILFGASLSGTYALSVLKSKGIEVLFFCDNDICKHGNSIDGVVIWSPKKLLEYPDIPVLVGSDYYADIFVQLKEIGVKSLFYFGFCFDFNRWFGHFNPQGLDDAMARIEYAFQLFDDNQSRSLYNHLVKFRYSLGSNGGTSSLFEEYFHPYVLPRVGDTIIDGGAWEGDTALKFSSELKGNCHIYSFEPENETFKRLTQNVISNNLSLSVFPVNSGLYSNTSFLKFNTDKDNTMQYEIDEFGTCEIYVTSIDEFAQIKELQIDLIKMDIEGSEIQALKGAANTISKSQPRLQICSYHKFDDLWEVPILIKELCPEYKLYLGHHSQHLFETIVYAYV